MERMELDRRHKQRLERLRDGELPRFGLLHLAGAIALLGLGAVVIAALPDIKRYIKISRM